MGTDTLHIERNSVQETLVIPLCARKLCSDRYPDLFFDPDAERLLARIDYDPSGLAAKSPAVMQIFGALEVASRQYGLALEAAAYLKDHPHAAVVNLGCGLDTTFSRVDNGMCRGFNLDLPDVIAVRDTLLPPGEREANLACDLNDPAWFDAVDFVASEGAVFYAAGVFYYFTVDQIRTLTAAMAKRFPGAILVFDAANARAVGLMRRTWIERAGIEDVSAFFSLEDESEPAAWSERFASVTSRKYMEGYRTLPRTVGILNKLIAKAVDGPLMRQRIVRIVFRA